MLLSFSFILTMNLICMNRKCKKVLTRLSNYISISYHFPTREPKFDDHWKNNFWSGFTCSSSTSDYPGTGELTPKKSCHFPILVLKLSQYLCGKTI